MNDYHDTHHARVLARINRDVAVMTENESAAGNGTNAAISSSILAGFAEALRIIATPDGAIETYAALRCPVCGEHAQESKWEFRRVGGGPFSGPLDGATPPDDVAICPHCGVESDALSVDEIRVCEFCGAEAADNRHTCVWAQAFQAVQDHAEDYH